jgi:heterodisulfide reductase subunit A
MTASLAIANQGFDVTLVERQKELGGTLHKLRYTIDEPDIHSYLQRLSQEVLSHEHIIVHTETELANVEGFVGNFESAVRVKGKEKKIKHGAVIVATGGNESRPTEYSYGRDKRVMTQLELEDLLSRDKLRAGVKTVVMIQCVGSREEGHMYCSRVCCNTAVKNAIKIKAVSPETEVYVLYRDIRTYGFSEEYFQKARDEGILFIRYDLDGKPKVSSNSDLTITVTEPMLKKELILRADLLVLSSRIDADSDNEKLAQLLKIPMNEDRFFLEAHVKLRPVEFATEGIFVAGMAHSPKSIPETIAQAKAAASKACAIISKDKYQGESRIANVNVTCCSACGACAEVCAYKAIEVTLADERLGTMAACVNPALCKGCGTCSAICRSGAVDVEGISDHQINLMITAK